MPNATKEQTIIHKTKRLKQEIYEWLKLGEKKTGISKNQRRVEKRSNTCVNVISKGY